MLIVKCSGCQSKIRLKPQFAGKRIKCPKCQAAVQVPTSPEHLTREQLPAEQSLQSGPLTAEPSSSVPSFPEEVTLQLAEDTSGPPSFQVDVNRPPTTPRRRQKSSVGIWLPICLVLIAGLVGMWLFMPPPASEVIAKDLPPQSVVEGKLLKLLIPIQSAGSGQPVGLKILEGPPNAAIDPDTHEFRWTPGESDGPGTFNIVVSANSGGETLEGHFQIVVTESDQPPAFEAMNRVPAQPVEPLKLTVTAKDPDQPSVAVTYSLINTNALTESATIDAQSGTITWSPSELLTGETASLTVRATENSDAALSSEVTLAIDVSRFDDPIRQFTADLKKQRLEVVDSESADKALKLPFEGATRLLMVNAQPVTVVLYDTEEQRQVDVEKIDQNGSKAFDVPWTGKDALNVYAKDRLLVAIVGTDATLLDQFSLILDRPVAIVRQYEPPPVTIRQAPAIVKALMPLYEEKAKRPGQPRKLFVTDSYKEVRKVFADQFVVEQELNIKTGVPGDFDELMSWFDEHKDLKEEFFTAIRPEFDDVSGAAKLFNQLRKEFPKQIAKYGSLAIATSVVWDNEAGVYTYNDQAERTHSTMPSTLIDGVDNFRYFTETEPMMQGRAQFIPWEFLALLVNHQTPVQERQWSLQAYLPSRQMFGKCYADVPYDTEMLQTASKVCRLGGKEYNLPNIRQFGGVCAMQADFAARVGKSIGVPAAYVWGEGRYGGSHAWVMWVELQAVSERSIRFSLESHGRYRGDNYYIGNLEDPHTGEAITDRMLELRLQQVGMDALTKRHADRLMLLYPQLAEELVFDFDSHLSYLSGVIGLNPWNEAAWTALSKLAQGRELGKPELKTMNTLVNQLFVNFAAFPDFTLPIFDDLISFEKDAKKRVAMYYQLLEVYSAAKRPDLAFTALLQLSELLEQEDRAGEAIQALAVAIQKYPEEGQYVPRMLDRLEQLASKVQNSEQTLAEFYSTFLPKVPKTRGDAPSEYCISMYNRAVPIFERVGQTQLAQNYSAAAVQMKSQLPK
jgi:tetratricopeptide (TPR) repeat protein